MRKGGRWNRLTMTAMHAGVFQEIWPACLCWRSACVMSETPSVLFQRNLSSAGKSSTPHESEARFPVKPRQAVEQDPEVFSLRGVALRRSLKHGIRIWNSYKYIQSAYLHGKATFDFTDKATLFGKGAAFCQCTISSHVKVRIKHICLWQCVGL